jgi:hypothetical protein
MNQNNFDTLIIELQKEGKSVASIAIKSYDLAGLETNYNQPRAEVIENIIQTMEAGLEERRNHIAD